MKIKLSIAAILLIITTSIYADDLSSIEKGAKQYDWQTCLDTKSRDCLNSCENSSDIHCSDNCNATANDKCLSEGVKPPQQ